MITAFFALVTLTFFVLVAADAVDSIVNARAFA